MADTPSEGLPLGPQPGVTYPIRVLYCGNCSLPIEVRPDKIFLFIGVEFILGIY